MIRYLNNHILHPVLCLHELKKYYSLFTKCIGYFNKIAIKYKKQYFNESCSKKKKMFKWTHLFYLTFLIKKLFTCLGFDG